MQMQAIKQNVDKTMQCKYDMQRGKKTKVEKPNKNHTMRASNKQRGKKADLVNQVKNHTMQVYAKGKENRRGKPRESRRC